MSKAKKPKKADMTPEDFVMLALRTLPDKEKGHTGFHPVWSGFNKAFKQLFPDLDPVEFTQKMRDDGKISIYPVKRGVIILPPSKRDVARKSGAEALEKMGLK